MTVVNFCGWEAATDAGSGDSTGMKEGTAASSLTSSGSSLVSSPVRNGSRCLRLAGQSSGTDSVRFADQSAQPAGTTEIFAATVVFGFAFRLSGIDAGDWPLTIATIGSSPSSELLRFKIIDDGGNLKIRITDELDSTLATGTTVLSQDTWYYAEIIGDADSDDVEVQLDGSSEIGATSYDWNVASTIGYCTLKNDADATTDYVYFDDVCIQTGVTTTFGPVRVERVSPDANGNYTAWTGSPGDYTNVDEFPAAISDSDVISSSTQNNAETPGYAALAGDVDSIKAAKVTAFVKKTSNPVTNMKLRIRRSSDTDSSSFDVQKDTIARSYSYVQENDPGTSSAWTETNFNAAEAGVVHDQVQSRSLDCTTLMWQAVYVEVSAQTISMPVVSATASVIVPTIQINLTITPPVVSATASVITPTVSPTVTLTPPVVSATASIFLPDPCNQFFTIAFDTADSGSGDRRYSDANEHIDIEDSNTLVSVATGVGTIAQDGSTSWTEAFKGCITVGGHTAGEGLAVSIKRTTAANLGHAGILQASPTNNSSGFRGWMWTDSSNRLSLRINAVSEDIANSLLELNIEYRLHTLMRPSNKTWLGVSGGVFDSAGATVAADSPFWLAEIDGAMEDGFPVVANARANATLEVDNFEYGVLSADVASWVPLHHTFDTVGTHVPSILWVTGQTWLIAIQDGGGNEHLTTSTGIKVFRSTDDGLNWSEVLSIAAPGGGKKVGLGCLSQLGANGDIYLTYLDIASGETTSNGTLTYRKSDDDGATWGGATSWGLAQTFSTFNPIIEFAYQGVLRQLMPVQRIETGGERALHILWSDDEGTTWNNDGTGEDFWSVDTTLSEPALVVETDGTLAVWIRHNSGLARRAFSSDGGQTWSSVSTPSPGINSYGSRVWASQRNNGEVVFGHEDFGTGRQKQILERVTINSGSVSSIEKVTLLDLGNKNAANEVQYACVAMKAGNWNDRIAVIAYEFDDAATEFSSANLLRIFGTGSQYVSGVTTTATASVIVPIVTTTVTLTPPAVTATASIISPTVSPTVTLTPPVVSAAASILIPTVTTTVTLTPPVVTATATAIAPTISVGGGPQTIVPPVVSATAGIVTPTVSPTVTITLPIVTATSTIISPVVSPVVVLTPPVVSATASVIAPTVSPVVTVTVPVVSATGAVTTPTIFVGVTITPPVVSATASVIAPTVSPVVTVTVPVVSATGSIFPPTIIFDQTITPPVISATSSAITPTVTPTVTLTTPVVSAAASILIPTVTTTVTLTAPVVSATGTIINPTVSPTVTITPPIVTASGLIIVPTVSPVVTITLPVVSATTIIVSPGISTSLGTTIIPTTVSATGLVFPPKVCIGGGSYLMRNRLDHVGDRLRLLSSETLDYRPVDGSEPFCISASPVHMIVEELVIGYAETRIERQDWVIDFDSNPGSFLPAQFPPKEGDILIRSNGEEYRVASEEPTYSFTTSKRNRIRIYTVRIKS